MKEIKKGESLIKFFLNSGERVLPMAFVLLITSLTSGYYLNNPIDEGIWFFPFFLFIILAIFIEGYLSWKKLNK